MSLLQNLNILRRIGLLVALPLLACSGFGFYIVFGDWRSMAAAEKIAQTAEIGPLLGAFAHEAQIERGLSASLLRDPGDSATAQAREKQLSRVDAAASALRATARARGASDSRSRELQEIFADIDQLPKLRSSVREGTIGADEAVSRYTSMVDASIAPVENLTREAQLSATARAIIAYGALLRAKESAGLERAAGARGFSPQDFDKAVYPRFAALASAQDVFLKMALQYAPPAGAEAIKAFLASPSDHALRELRAKAEAAALRGGSGVERSAWFAAASARISAMKAIEDFFARDLIDGVAASTSQARRNLCDGGRAGRAGPVRRGCGRASDLAVDHEAVAETDFEHDGVGARRNRRQFDRPRGRPRR